MTFSEKEILPLHLMAVIINVPKKLASAIRRGNNGHRDELCQSLIPSVDKTIEIGVNGGQEVDLGVLD